MSGSREERERERVWSGAREGVWLRWALVGLLPLLLVVVIEEEMEGGWMLREAAEALPEGGPEKRNGGGAREGCRFGGESVAILLCGRRNFGGGGSGSGICVCCPVLYLYHVCTDKSEVYRVEAIMTDGKLA